MMPFLKRTKQDQSTDPHGAVEEIPEAAIDVHGELLPARAAAAEDKRLEARLEQLERSLAALDPLARARAEIGPDGEMTRADLFMTALYEALPKAEVARIYADPRWPEWLANDSLDDGRLAQDVLDRGYDDQDPGLVAAVLGAFARKIGAEGGTAMGEAPEAPAPAAMPRLARAEAAPASPAVISRRQIQEIGDRIAAGKLSGEAMEKALMRVARAVADGRVVD